MMEDLSRRTDEAKARELTAGSGRRKPRTSKSGGKPGWEASGPDLLSKTKKPPPASS